MAWTSSTKLEARFPDITFSFVNETLWKNSRRTKMREIILKARPQTSNKELVISMLIMVVPLYNKYPSKHHLTSITVGDVVTGQSTVSIKSPFICHSDPSPQKICQPVYHE
jgi:hypothetical protein